VTGPGRTVLIFAALVVIAAGIKAAEAIMVPFLLAVFIATIASTPMIWLERKGCPGWLAILLVITAIVLVLFGIGALVAQSATSFMARRPFYAERLSELYASSIAFLEGYGLDISIATDYFNPATALAMAGNTLAGLGGALSNGFLIILTVIFILAEATSFPNKLRSVLANPEADMVHFERFASLVNRYIALKTSVSALTGIVITIFLSIIGVDVPVLWGLLAFLLNYVPNIGSIIAAVPPVLLAIVQLDFGLALLIAGGYLAVNLVMGNVIEPRYMGRGLGLSSLVVFLSLAFWGWMLGPVGMLLSVPLTMTARIALEVNPDTRWLAHMLGPAEPAPTTTAPPSEPATPAGT
jgi:predicted PurR-regulated permease PerM